MSETATTAKSEAALKAPLMLSVSGCRGIVGKSLTPELATKYAAAIACWVIEQSGKDPHAPAGSANKPRVILARDGRVGGDAISMAVSAALAGSGCDVVRLGVATTPTAGRAVLDLQADAGLVITASHNPQQWNGIKTISALGSAPPKQDADKIIAAFHAGETAYVGNEHIGAITEDEGAAERHVQAVLKAVGSRTDLDAVRSAGLKAIVDSVNCSGGSAAMLILEHLGVGVTMLHDDGSGLFPHTPEPIVENLGGLADAVRRHGANVGFAQDPDADRLALVDETGTFIGEEYTLAIGAMALLEILGDEAKGATLVANLSTSRMIEDVAASFGATVKRSAVGEANVVQLMRDSSAPAGGEGNGGVIWPEVVPIRDSIGAMALVLALMARRGKTLSELKASIPSYTIVKRKTAIRDGLAQRAQDAVATKWANEAIDRQDGVRVDLKTTSGGDAWLHVRASNTEPILRLIAEAPSDAEATSLLDEAEAVIAAAE